MTSTGIGARSASVRTAAPSPWSTSTAGWIPRASSRSSGAPPAPRARSRRAARRPRRRRRARLSSWSAMPMPSRRCCAPSWRSRSSRLRSSSPARTMRARDSRSSGSWARSSACSRSFSSASAPPTRRLEQRGLVEENRVVHDGREVVADQRHGPIAALRERDLAAILVGPDARSGSQSASSSVGSPMARASAWRTPPAPPRSSSTTRSPRTPSPSRYRHPEEGGEGGGELPVVTSHEIGVRTEQPDHEADSPGSTT